MLYVIIVLVTLNIGLTIWSISTLLKITKIITQTKENANLSWNTLKALRAIMTDKEGSVSSKE